MSKKKRFVGKIGYCNNLDLGIRNQDGRVRPGGYYVYIRKYCGIKHWLVHLLL